MAVHRTPKYAAIATKSKNDSTTEKTSPVNYSRLLCINGLWRTAIVIVVFFFLAYCASERAVSPDSGCIKWRDSLVVAGMQSLDNNKFAEARRYFTGAFRCGMRKDSMYFYIAELYLRQMILDTALVFNQAVEKLDLFPREMWIMQRAKIYWLLGRKIQADSLMVSIQKKSQHDFSLSLSGIRNIIALNKFTFVPQEELIRPSRDIDDAGDLNVSYRYSRLSNRINLPWSVQLFLNSYFPVPTQYYADEISDTLFKSYGLSLGIGTIAKTPEFVTGLRLKAHPERRNDFYPYVRFSIPIIKQNLFMVRYVQKWPGKSVLDDSRLNVSLIHFLSKKKSDNVFNLMLSHHFARTQNNQSIFDSSGNFRAVPKGYISMDEAALADTTEMLMKYFKDSECTLPFSVLLGKEWQLQPAMYFMVRPEHDINASFKYAFTRRLPFASAFTLVTRFEGIYYPKKVIWYTINNAMFKYNTLNDLFNGSAIVYNNADKAYYLSIDRTQRRYFTNSLVKLDIHEKRRIDAYLFVSSTLRKELGKFGAIYGTGSFTKGFSTLKEKDPMMTINNAWELSTGWEKKITLKK